MAPPIVRGVTLELARGGIDAVLTEAALWCWTGRDAAGDACTVVADYVRLPLAPDGTPVPDYDQQSTPTLPGAAHHVLLGDLTPGGYYRLRLRATQTGGDEETATTPDWRFVATPGPVPPGPALSAIAAGTITATGATITWTSAPACPPGQVDYSTSPTLAPLSVQSEAPGLDATAHTVTLAGLTAATRYYYRVFQVAGDGSSTLSSLRSFVTAAV